MWFFSLFAAKSEKLAKFLADKFPQEVPEEVSKRVDAKVLEEVRKLREAAKNAKEDEDKK